jgi:hypothetical protein
MREVEWSSLNADLNKYDEHMCQVNAVGEPAEGNEVLPRQKPVNGS